MTDITERLREAASVWRDERHRKFLLEAADEIEQLREALRCIHEHALLGQDKAGEGFIKICGMVRDALTTGKRDD